MSLLAGSLRALAASAVMAVAAGCMVTVGVPAGDTGLYYTRRGAETTVAVPITRAFWAGRRTFAEMGIRQKDAELEHEDDDEGEESEAKVKGRRADLKVEVKLSAHGQGPTRVRVTAKRDDLGWDRDFARTVLERIVTLAH